MLHVRDMLPNREQDIPEVVVEVVETEEPLYERDRETGLLLKTDEAVKVRREVRRETGKRIVLKGAWEQVDTHCHDCGAEFVPSPDDRPFAYMLCGRLNIRDPEGRRPEGGRWLPTSTIVKDDDGAEHVVWRLVDSEEPYEGCVLECGGWQP